MAKSLRMTRRSALKVAGGAMALPLVHIRTAGAAGKLKVAFLSGFIPQQDVAMKSLTSAWAQQSKTDVDADFIPIIGDKYLLTMAAEAAAGTGHDVVMPFASNLATHAHVLEPLDTLVARLSAKYGMLAPLIDDFAKADGAYRGVPASFQSNGWPSETRIDLFKQYVGIDVTTVFPAVGEMGPGYDRWTWEAFLIAAEKCASAGYPFGLPMGKTSDSTFWVGALFHGFGAELVDRAGNITVRSDNVRKVLDYGRRLMPAVSSDVYSWDNASNNRAKSRTRSSPRLRCQR